MDAVKFLGGVARSDANIRWLVFRTRVDPAADIRDLMNLRRTGASREASDELDKRRAARVAKLPARTLGDARDQERATPRCVMRSPDTVGTLTTRGCLVPTCNFQTAAQGLSSMLVLVEDFV